MKLPSRLCLALCLLAALPAAAQEREDTVSVAEMVDGFMKQYVEQCYAPPEWEEADRVVYGETYGYDPERKGEISLPDESKSNPDDWAFCSVPGLRQAGDTVLPRSKYVWAIDYVETSPNAIRAGGCTLYWLETLDGKPEDNERLRRYLEARYGSEIFNDTLKLIPVRWYEGTVACLQIPYLLYGYRPLARHLLKGELRNGKMETGEEPDGRYSYSSGSLFLEAKNIEDGSMNTFFLMRGRRGDKIDLRNRRQAIRLLAVKLNDTLRRMGRTEEWEKKKTDREFALLFYMDHSHKTCLRPLLPQEPDAIDRRLLSDLSAALDEQPPGILPEFYALDGRRFAGVYLKARCVHGRWTLEDYIGDFYYEL